jgi:hypothetical protein
MKFPRLNRVAVATELPVHYQHILATFTDYNFVIPGVYRANPEYAGFYKEQVSLEKYCLTGGTKVSLVNGTEVPIKDLVGRDPFWVYSYDHETGKIVPGRATARKTRGNAELVEVTLDNGEKVRCTPDHPWMLRDGSYREAKDLAPGTSLMPLYRKVGHGPMGDKIHRFVQSLHTGKWFPFFAVAAGRKPDNLKGVKAIRHHKDFNPLNDDPENLVWTLVEEHTRIHMQLPEARERSRKVGRANRGRKRTTEFCEVCRQRMLGRKATKCTREAHSRSWTRERREAHSRFMCQFYTDLRERKKMGLLVQKALLGRALGVRSAAFREKCRVRMLGNQLAKGSHNWNHTVVSIRHLNEREEVYCLVVQKHHNFALSSGVFTHNCVLDNGAFEGDLFSVEDLVRLVEELKPHEVVLPDVIGDSKATVIGSKACLNRLGGNIVVQVCPQGSTFSEWVDCYRELSELPGVSCIGLSYIWTLEDPMPWDFFGPMNPMEAARLRSIHHLVGTGYLKRGIPHHLLGLSDPRALRWYAMYPFIRSIDTSFPIATALVYKQMSRLSPKPKGKLDYGVMMTPQVVRLAVENIQWLQRELTVQPTLRS